MQCLTLSFSMNVLKIAVQSDYGIGHPDIEPPEFSKRLMGEISDRVLVTNVRDHSEGFNSECFAFVSDFIQGVLASRG